jgi:hypothetical protein
MTVVYIDKPEDQPPFALEGDQLVISRPLALTVPRTVELLTSTPPALWYGKFEAAAELGAGHLAAAETSATIQLMDERVTGLFEKLDHDVQARFSETLTADRELVKKGVGEILTRFEKDFNTEMRRYLDPNAPDAFPTLVTKRLEDTTRLAMKGIDGMLTNAETGVLAEQTKTIVKSMRDEMEILKRLFIERQALHDLGTAKGRTLEEELALRLGAIARPLMGEVERVADFPGLKKTKHGDLILTVQGPLSRGHCIRIAFEAKDHAVENGAFSLEAVRQGCRLAAENRGAQVAVFITDAPELLPEARSFGTVDGHYWLAYQRGGDDTALAVVVNTAVAQVLLQLAATNGDGFEAEAAQREVSGLLSTLEKFDEVESCHSSAVRAIQKAGTAAAALRSALIKGLGRLDSLLAPE